MTRIVLLRHGQTDWNFTRRIQGSSDIPLNDVGREQARAAAATLEKEEWDAIYSSPLSRAFDTARIVAAELSLDRPVPLPGMVERGYGLAEGLTRAEMLAAFPDGVVPGRETDEELSRRVLPALDEVASRHPDGSILVVTHGGVIGTLVRSLTNDELPGEGGRIANGSTHTFEHTGGALTLLEFAGSPEDLNLVAESSID